MASIFKDQSPGISGLMWCGLPSCSVTSRMVVAQEASSTAGAFGHEGVCRVSYKRSHCGES